MTENIRETEEARNCRDIVLNLAGTANIVIASETAYDITDSLKTNPDQYPFYFYELARLAAKILKDIERKIEDIKNESDRKILDNAKRALLGFRQKLEDIMNCLESLGEEERRRLVLEFAALAVAPDQRAQRVASILRRRQSSS